ncbi:hypothetical protein ACFY2M_01770 [Streptomyces sp. NPDC001276]|uniref:hypothetical protein n=1 Tax=Streptomyces sp. NPDC001276 TaxID=3364555 RepID=UPI0036C94A52
MPEMVPHSFANRDTDPLTILAANTGYGIDHEDYAITAPEAERRAAGPSHSAPTAATYTATHSGTLAPVDYLELAAALRDIERGPAGTGAGVTTVRERLAARLRRLARGSSSPC